MVSVNLEVCNETVLEIEVFIIALMLVTPIEDQLNKRKSPLREGGYILL